MGNKDSQKGHDDGRAGKYKPPPNASFIDSAVNPRKADQDTKRVKDYQNAWPKGNDERKRNR